MRTLIDGYNLMFAGGLLGKRFGPDGFRKVRHRFLNDLAAALDATEAHLTTVVFDAAAPPHDRPSTARHKGITVLYAVNRESADEQIEDLIKVHSSPKTLTVVSSDHRIQQAATRRRSKVLTADAFWVEMDARKEKKQQAARAEAAEARRPAPTGGEAAYWAREFADVEDSEDARALFEHDPIFPTDAEIARIEREVEAEFRRR